MSIEAGVVIDTLRSLVPAFVRRRYLAKFAAVVLLVMVLTAGLGVVFQQQVSAELTHDVHAEMETVAELEANELHQWVEEHEQIARMLSSYDGLQPGASDIDGRLDRELDSLPDATHGVHYVDLDSGTIERSTTEGLDGASLAAFDLRWASGSLEFESAGETAVSEGFRYEGAELVAFASPIAGTSKVVLVTVDAQERAEHFRDPIEGGYTQVVDSHGRIEFAPNDSAALTTYAGGANASALQAGLNGESGAVERDETGEVVAYAPVEGTDWVVLTHAPQSNAYALRGTITADFLWLIGIALAGFCLIGLTIGRNTVRSLQSIRDRAERIAVGDLDVSTADSHRIDEVGQAFDAFDDTIEYLDTVAAQSEAIAAQEFDDPVLEKSVPGALGESLATMRTDLETFIADLESTQAEAEAAREEAEAMADSLEDTAESIRRAVETAADGDLTVRLDEDGDHEAMVDIAVAFNDLLEDLGGTVVTLQEFADEVAVSSEQITASAEEVKSASEDVSTSIQEIAEGASQQNRNIHQASGEMTDMSATIEEIASSSDEVADVTAAAADLGETGTQSAAAAVREMDAIESTAREAIDEVEALDEEMAAIGEIVDLIDDIAEQTNILALNASIEAARAGEAGEGFAVVADEVKGLAEDTREATQEIESRINTVQATASDAAADMQAMGDSVTDGIETVDEAVQALESIVERVEDANAGVQSINQATDEQAASTEEVVSMVDEVGSISEETAAEAQQVAASAEEQTASITEVTNSIVTLSDQSARLHDLLAEFTVDHADHDVEIDLREADGQSGAAGATADRPAPTDDD